MTDEKSVLCELSNEYGMFMVKEAEANGINRYRLSYLASKNKIARIGHGIYALKDDFVDDYVLLQKGSRRIIYSHHTTLYFHDLSDRVPSQIHITVPQGYNASRIKNRYDDIVVHYSKKDNFELGKENGRSPYGGEIILYNVERTICDIVKDKNQIDSQVFTHALKEYFKDKKINLRKLLKYAKILNVEEPIRQYIEVLG